MIVIIGESSCGKSSVADYISQVTGRNKIITYTTRPQRDGEKDGVDYYFINKSHFENLRRNGFFLEVATYNGWYYGSAKEDYLNDNSVVVLTPSGLRELKNSNINNIYSVYIKVPRRDRLIKCLERGDDIDEAYRRNLSDLGQYDGVKKEVNCTIENPNYVMDVTTIGDIIIKKASENERV